MAAEDKNKRATRMVNSSMTAGAKKGGAGGGYTWGSAMDVQDFVSTGVVADGSVGLVTVPTPTAIATASSPVFQMDQSAFPALGTTSTSVAVRSWGPSTLNTTVVGSTAIRPGVAGVLGQQHPRNLFAKKAIPQPTQVVAANVEQGMIDWSKSGMPVETMQAVVRQAAHLGPFQAQGATTLPLDTLRARNVGTVIQQQAVAPSIVKQPVAMSKPTIIQQPR